MKAILAIAMWLAADDGLAAMRPVADYTVHVYLSGGAPVSGAQFLAAQERATRLLAPAGVRLVWHTESPKTGLTSPDALHIGFVDTVPNSLGALKTNVLAVARPYASGGQKILVFSDRVANFILPFRKNGAAVLGHILAHEVCHVLEAIAFHSDTGLMRASWTGAEISAMFRTGLPLAPEDRELVRAGLKARGMATHSLLAEPETR